jgi:hypothetical protein
MYYKNPEPTGLEPGLTRDPRSAASVQVLCKNEPLFARPSDVQQKSAILSPLRLPFRHIGGFNG